MTVHFSARRFLLFELYSPILRETRHDCCAQRPTALVTGSTNGIGQGVAQSLAAAGAHVIVHGLYTVRGPVADAITSAGGAASFFFFFLSRRPIACTARPKSVPNGLSWTT